jgi:hypothetical protein
MVRRHCATAPFGQTIRISVSGMSASASQVANFLPSSPALSHLLPDRTQSPVDRRGAHRQQSGPHFRVEVNR